MEPLGSDENVQQEETPTSTAADAGLVTGPAPFDVADDDDWEED